jgi:hypothetical protein
MSRHKGNQRTGFFIDFMFLISQTNAECYRSWYSISMTAMSTSELYSLISSKLFLIIVHVSVRLLFIIALDPLLLPLSSFQTSLYLGLNGIVLNHCDRVYLLAFTPLPNVLNVLYLNCTGVNKFILV